MTAARRLSKKFLQLLDDRRSRRRLPRILPSPLRPSLPQSLDPLAMKTSAVLSGLALLAVHLAISPRKRLLSSADDLDLHHAAGDGDHSGHSDTGHSPVFRHVHEAPLLSVFGGIGLVLLGYCAAQLIKTVRENQAEPKNGFARLAPRGKEEPQVDRGWFREGARLLRLALVVLCVKNVGPVRTGILLLARGVLGKDYALAVAIAAVALSQVQRESSLVACLALAGVSAAEPLLPRSGSRVPVLGAGALVGLLLFLANFKLDAMLLPLVLLSGSLLSASRSTLLSSAAASMVLSPLPSSDLLTLLPALVTIQRSSLAAWRAHLSAILLNQASRKIFYFLLLNLSYMFVQLSYGLYTNSLGLISDAIHMLFDCLGLGIGLWASVAAAWPADARYTFGYTRVETLSGFGNGVFLMLVSIFIIFEGVQRVFNPPEMETRQLLLVSSVGLGINLFGMWATGGHHHHGHGHSHGHEVHEKKTDDHHHGHAHEHDHGNANGACNGHSHSNGHDHGHDHDHAHSIGHSHSHSHSHDHHDHDHSHSNGHSHSHDPHHGHSPSHGHSHGHDHAHSHNMHGVFLHVLADTLGSVGVIVSTLLIRYTGLTIWDPLASLFIALLILASVTPLVLESGRVLALDIGDDSSVRRSLADLNAQGVSFSAPRFWQDVSGLKGSLHLQLSGSRLGVDRVKGKVRAALEPLGLKELVIQAEGDKFCDCMTG